MEDDIRSYRAHSSKLPFKDVATRNLAYSAVAKVLYVPGQFFAYVNDFNCTVCAFTESWQGTARCGPSSQVLAERGTQEVLPLVLLECH
jgi:hypothetical protein